ncbi:atrial natriuretic peptide-converting enzyme-like protein [Leptotrombidium deliense]|uniref:Atrial natriuretic peptide-converting enzyme-like protein n=1 Tax=Leptotrombidium deliense TaxID=299467 RepID=A0A443STT9_9ACAR|nr:atrial natriuretic peptide-converting enzyme-like protein [Leptotrombidium deliense]
MRANKVKDKLHSNGYYNQTAVHAGNHHSHQHPHQQHQYAIPPPHAHSLIHKRESIGGTVPEVTHDGTMHSVTRGESYNPKYENPNSDEFKDTAKVYKEKLDQLYNNSHYAKAFKKSEIIALEKNNKLGSDDVLIHFNLHFAPQASTKMDSADLYVVLGDEILNNRHQIFKNISIDHNTISLQERRPDTAKRGLFYSSSVSFPASEYFGTHHEVWEPRTKFPGLLEGLKLDPTPPPRKCASISLPFCTMLPYNLTSFPNIIGHWNSSSLEEDFIAFRQIVDFECYLMAREFICGILQPECRDDDMIWPCREFCDEFRKSCEHFIPRYLLKKIKCKSFPSPSDNSDSNSDTNSDSANNDNAKKFDSSKSRKKETKIKCRTKQEFRS